MDRGYIAANDVNGAVLLYTAYIAAVAALVAGALLYRRWKVRKPVNKSYGYVSFPPGSDSLDDRIEFFCGKRRD